MGTKHSKSTLEYRATIAIPVQQPDERELRRKRRAEHIETQADNDATIRTKARHLQRLHHDLPLALRLEAAEEEKSIPVEDAEVAAARLRRVWIAGHQDLKVAAAGLLRELARMSNDDKISAINALLAGAEAVPMLSSRLLHQIETLRRQYSYARQAPLLDPRVQRSKVYFNKYLAANLYTMARSVLQYKPCGVDVTAPYTLRTRSPSRTTTRSAEEVAAIVDTRTNAELLTYVKRSIELRDCAPSLFRVDNAGSVPVVAAIVLNIHGAVSEPLRATRTRSSRLTRERGSAALENVRVPPTLFVGRIGATETTYAASTLKAKEYVDAVRSVLNENSDPVLFASQIEDHIGDTLMVDRRRTFPAMFDDRLVQKSNVPITPKIKMDFAENMILGADKPRMKYFLPGELMVNKHYNTDEDASVYVTLLIPGQDDVNLLEVLADEFDLKVLLEYAATSYDGLTHLILVDLACQKVEAKQFASTPASRALLGGNT